MKKRKLCIWMISVICILGLTSIKAYADQITFQVKNQTGRKGEVVTVPIEVQGEDEIGGFDITVYYDTDALKFKSLNQGKLIAENKGSALFDYNHLREKAAVKIVYVVADTIKADGCIANLEFEIKKDLESELPIAMKINDTVNGTEESKKIRAMVSGTDNSFQKEINKEAENTEKSNDENKEESTEKSNYEKKKRDELKTLEDKKETAEIKKNKGKDKVEEKKLIVLIVIMVGSCVGLICEIIMKSVNRKKEKTE